MTVEFELNGQTFTALNGGPTFKFNEAISFQVSCRIRLTHRVERRIRLDVQIAPSHDLDCVAVESLSGASSVQYSR